MREPLWLRVLTASLAVLGILGVSGFCDGARTQPAVSSAAHPSWPVIVPVTPRVTHPVPVNSPLAYVAARVTARAPIARVLLLIDGRRVTPELAGRDRMHLSIFYQPRHLAPGMHCVYVAAWDTAGSYGWRQWDLRITPTRDAAALSSSAVFGAEDDSAIWHR